MRFYRILKFTCLFFIVNVTPKLHSNDLRYFRLTLSLVAAIADSLDPDQDRQNVGSVLDLNRLTL